MIFMLDIVTKRRKCYYKMGSLLFYKTGQVVLQSRVGLQNGTIFITKWGWGYCNVEQSSQKRER